LNEVHTFNLYTFQELKSAINIEIVPLNEKV